MTVHSSSKPSSTPRRTSQDATAIAKDWQASNREQLKASKTDKQIQDELAKVLANDRQAISAVRTKVAKGHNFSLLHTAEQERQMTEAAMLCISKRIASGRYASCTYPEFEGFIPQLAFGVKGRTDPVSKKCINLQLVALRKASAAGEYASSDDDDDDDDDDDEEDPLPVKTEENTTKRKMSDFFPVTGKNETRLSKDSTNPGRQDSANEQDKNDKTTAANRRSQGRNTTAHTPKQNRVDKSHYSSNSHKNHKKELITWRAVSRGQPMLPGSPPANFMHWKPKSNPWFGRVVFRGQITAEDGKDED
jgi:hypothetical protein